MIWKRKGGRKQTVKKAKEIKTHNQKKHTNCNIFGHNRKQNERKI